jgi:hypothetical protein
MSTDTVSQPESGPVWTDHGRKMWHNPRRNDVHSRDRARAWGESVRVEYPSAYDGAFGRYHRDGDVVLICKRTQTPDGRRPVIVTVIDLTDRPLWEQEYVRYQAVYGGRS